MAGSTVWLASFPKSGNTWIRAVYSSLMSDGPLDINRLADGPQSADITVFERVLGIPRYLMTGHEVELLRPRVDEVLDRETSGLLFRKIHDALHSGPSGELIVSTAATRAAIYVVRDPRDVAVSFAHHLSRPLAEASRLLVSGGVGGGRSGHKVTHRPHLYDLTLPQQVGSWSEHVVSWVDDAPFPVHTVRYEDCVEDPLTTFGEAFRSVGLETGHRELLRAVESSAFDQLRAQEEAVDFHERVGQGRFFRRGEAASWRSELPPAEARRIEQAHGPLMARFGYL